MIRLDHVTKVYPGDHVAIDDMSLHIGKGEFTFILGHSGAGKSTLLKMLLREEKPTDGRVYVDGEDITLLKERQVPDLRRKMGVVFQDFRLIPTLNVYDNVAFAMRVTNVPEKIIRERVPVALELVHLEDKLDALPEAMSGGEQQRVALARALVRAPKLLIADEPTGNIDPELSVEMMKLLMDVNDVGTTVVVVTHEHELVHEFHRRVITLDHGHVLRDEPATEQFAMAGEARV